MKIRTPCKMVGQSREEAAENISIRKISKLCKDLWLKYIFINFYTTAIA